MKKVKITEQVGSYEDACQILGINPDDLPIVDTLPEKDRQSIIAYYKLTVIIRALNEGWEPDWVDWSQYKYYNWFYVDRSSSAFRFYAAAHASAGVGSRLCFKTRDLAAYAAKKFEELYKDYFLIP